jgi:hypothetical protein
MMGERRVAQAFRSAAALRLWRAAHPLAGTPAEHHHATDDLSSTVRGGSGILVDVHPVLRC